MITTMTGSEDGGDQGSENKTEFAGLEDSKKRPTFSEMIVLYIVCYSPTMEVHIGKLW
jgi:hypothetical protein